MSSRKREDLGMTTLKIMALLALVAGMSACNKPNPRPDWKGSVDVMIRNLSDPDATARRNAAVALGIMGERAEKALPDLDRARDDEDWKVREAAEVAFSRIHRALDRRASAPAAALVARSAP
jgi:HEAT repeat protein